MTKRLISLLLTLCLLAALPFGAAFAQEEELPTVIVESYDGETTQQTILSSEEAAAIPMPMAAVTYYDTLEEAASALRQQLLLGETSVSVGVNLPYESSLVNEVYNLALAHTGNPKEGDYLANRCRGYSASISYNSSRFSITYTPNYATTAAQEAQVDAKVAEILKSIRKDTDYHAVLDIFRWLRSNVTYQTGDIIQHTAYGALINGSGVCESYASAFYRLALACGVDSRIVTGLLIDGGHAWNIVELDGVYYIIDATNDVFLRCPASVEGLLILDSEFETDAFRAAYPMTTQDYTADISYTYDSAAATLTLPTTDSVEDFYRDVTDLLMEQYLGGIPNSNFKYSVAPWESMLDEIKVVKIGGSPSYIPSRMFYWNDVIREVTIPTSVTTIQNNAFNSCVSLKDIYFTGTQAQWNAITVEDYNNALGWATVHVNAAPVTGLTVSGTVTSFGSNTDNVTVQLIKIGTSTAAYSVTVKGNSAGYAITDVASGTYTLKVMKTKHATREYTVTVGASDVTQNVQILLYGDVTGDGLVNSADATQINRYFSGKSSVITGGDSETQAYRLLVANVYSTDNTINATDATQIKRHFSGKTSVFDSMP